MRRATGRLQQHLAAAALARRPTLRRDVRNARSCACRELTVNNRRLREELATANELNDLLMQRCREVVAQNISYQQQLKGTSR